MIYHYGVLPKYVKGGSILLESASLTTSGADLQIGDGLFFDPTTQWPNGRGFFLICNNANYSLFFNSQSLNNFHFFFIFVEWRVHLVYIVCIVQTLRKKVPVGNLQTTGETTVFVTSGGVSGTSWLFEN